MLRDVWFGRVLMAAAATVVKDSDDLLVTYVPPGSGCMRTPVEHSSDFMRTLASREWTLERRDWHTTRRLGLFRPGTRHALSAFFTDTGELLTWYVDFIDPLVRTSFGFDLRDLVLDIVIAPDLSFEMKDEDDFALAQELGAITADEAASVREEAHRVIDSISDPWWLEWRDWAPDPSWPIPTLPDGWDGV